MNVMITGAAGGLGRAMAVECAKRGYSLFLTDLDAEGLEAIREGLSRRFRIRIHAKACDLTDSAGVDALMAQASRLGLTFDMLLNVAGVDFEGGFLKREREKVMRIVALNNEGTLRITHAVLQRRTPNRRFTVVLVSSLASLFPMPLKATYAASKRFLLDFGLALQGRPRYIPSAFNRMLFLLGKAVPPSWAAAFIHRRWTRTQKKWLFPSENMR